MEKFSKSETTYLYKILETIFKFGKNMYKMCRWIKCFVGKDIVYKICCWRRFSIQDKYKIWYCRQLSAAKNYFTENNTGKKMFQFAKIE